MTPTEIALNAVESYEFALKVLSQFLIAAAGFSALFSDTTYIDQTLQKKRLTPRGWFEASAIVVGLGLFGLGEYVSMKNEEVAKAAREAEVETLGQLLSEQKSTNASLMAFADQQEDLIGQALTLGARARAMDLGQETLQALRAAWSSPSTSRPESGPRMWTSLLGMLESADPESAASVRQWANACASEPGVCYISVINRPDWEASGLADVGNVIHAKTGRTFVGRFAPEQYSQSGRDKKRLFRIRVPAPTTTQNWMFPSLRIGLSGLDRPLLFASTFKARYSVTMFRYQSLDQPPTFGALFTFVDTGIRLDQLERELEVAGEDGSWMLESLDPAAKFRVQVDIRENTHRIHLSPSFSDRLPAIDRERREAAKAPPR